MKKTNRQEIINDIVYHRVDGLIRQCDRTLEEILIVDLEWLMDDIQERYEENFRDMFENEEFVPLGELTMSELTLMVKNWEI